MVVIRTEIKEIPEYCEQCEYYYISVHEKGGYSDICELSGLSGEHLNYGECTDGWYYNGLARPVNCPLMEVSDGK